MRDITNTLQQPQTLYKVFLAVALLALLAVACAPPNFTTPQTDEIAELTTPAAIATHTPTPAPTNTPTPLPTNTPTPLPTNTPTPLPTDTPVVEELKSDPTPVPASDRFTVLLTETELNTIARDAVTQQNDVQIDNVYVKLSPGRITVGGRTVLAIFAVDIEITTELPVVNGKPDPQIVSVKVNGSEVGGFMRTQIENMIAPYLQQFAQTDLNADIEKITITDDEMRIEGRFK